MSIDRKLISMIEQLGSASVACVGDLMLDHFVYGDVTRVSPEAPIPVLQIDHQQSMLGGLGNVVRNLGAMGCEIKVFSVTGDDEAGRQIASLLRAIPGCKAHLLCEPGRKTPVKTRYVAHGQQLLRADDETVSPISDQIFNVILETLDAHITECSILILSDYSKGTLAGRFASELIRIANKHATPVIVDPKGRDYSRYRHATLIKPNLKELGEASGLSVANTIDQEKAARSLLDQTGAAYILVTRGASGMVLVPRDGTCLEFSALAHEVYDVSGAGDTVASVLAAALGSGCAINEAVSIANVAAGIVVGKVGTAVVAKSEIIHEVESHSSSLTSNKILPIYDLAEQTRVWKRRGLKVGFVAGIFDMVAPDDLRVLDKLHSIYDRLIIGLLSDSAIYKSGLTKPRQTERTRAYVLSSMMFSDAVIIYDSPTPDELLTRLDVDSANFLETHLAAFPT